MKTTVKARQNAHARKRAAERHGIALTKRVRREIVTAIQEGKARHISSPTFNRTIWEVEVEGKKIAVIYNKSTKALVTVLPSDARELNNRVKLTCGHGSSDALNCPDCRRVREALGMVSQ